jgi:hypothetical protein
VKIFNPKIPQYLPFILLKFPISCHFQFIQRARDHKRKDKFDFRLDHFSYSGVVHLLLPLAGGGRCDCNRMVVGFTTIHFYRRYFAHIKGKRKYDMTPYPLGKAFLFVIMFISVRLGSISVICIVCQF